MKDTSKIAFKNQQEIRKTRSDREVIYDLLLKSPEPLTRNQISKITGIPINIVCPRVNELLDPKKPMIKVTHEAPDPSTSYKGSVEYLAPLWPQPKLNGNQYEFNL